MRFSSLSSVLGAVLFAAACSPSNDVVATVKPKPDPYITVRFRNLADTTTAIGRAHWHIYMNITSADPNQAAFVVVGNIGLNDLRLNHTFRCQGVGADSIGQRLVAFLALADTMTSELTAQAPADSVARAWVAGNQSVPAGWMALYQPSADAWTSQQFAAGHGLFATDPIKWGFDWAGNPAPAFYERTDTDATCGNFF
jgi:hypothetical protein